MKRTTTYTVILVFLVGCGVPRSSDLERAVESGPFLVAPGDTTAVAMRMAAGTQPAMASMFGFPIAGRLLATAAGSTTAAEEARSAGTIAGHLVGSYDDFTFTSDGGEMIFAVLDSTVYQMAGRGTGHEGGEAGAAAAAASPAGAKGSDCGKSGCTTRPGAKAGIAAGTVGSASSGGESGGCGGETGGGPPGMCMQILDRSGQVVCWADRAKAPGWMRDPKLACPLELVGGYTLRIFRRGTGGSPCGPGASYPSPSGDARAYLLTVAKKKIAPTGPLSTAIEVGGGSH